MSSLKDVSLKDVSLKSVSLKDVVVPKKGRSFVKTIFSWIKGLNIPFELNFANWYFIGHTLVSLSGMLTKTFL